MKKAVVMYNQPPQFTQPSSWAGSPFFWPQWYSWEARLALKLLTEEDPGVTCWCPYLHEIQGLMRLLGAPIRIIGGNMMVTQT